MNAKAIAINKLGIEPHPTLFVRKLNRLLAALLFIGAAWLVIFDPSWSAHAVLGVLLVPPLALVPLALAEYGERWSVELPLMCVRFWREVLRELPLAVVMIALVILKVLSAIFMLIPEEAPAKAGGSAPVAPSRSCGGGSGAAGARFELVPCPKCYEGGFTAPGWTTCHRCSGIGMEGDRTCRRCHGERKARCTRCRGSGEVRRRAR